jgi:negative regulator of flagellin synthesis FlgM
MKISSSTPNYINQTYANQTNSAANTLSKPEKPVDESAIATSSDSLKISSKTRDLQKISAAMDTEPADRTVLVADLKQQVQAGQYTVNAEQVAERMIGTFMNERA